MNIMFNWLPIKYEFLKSIPIPMSKKAKYENQSTESDPKYLIEL